MINLYAISTSGRLH